MPPGTVKDHARKSTPLGATHEFRAPVTMPTMTESIRPSACVHSCWTLSTDLSGNDVARLPTDNRHPCGSIPARERETCNNRLGPTPFAVQAPVDP